jgi:quinol monooxygenase YgiN
MVHATIRLVIPSKKRHEVMDFLNGMVQITRLRQGCIHSRLYRDANEEQTLMLEELWRSEDDLNHHLRSNEYHSLLMIMEMSLDPPEIKFHTISGSTGIETIEKVRLGRSQEEGR